MLNNLAVELFLRIIPVLVYLVIGIVFAYHGLRFRSRREVALGVFFLLWFAVGMIFPDIVAWLSRIIILVGGFYMAYSAVQTVDKSSRRYYAVMAVVLFATFLLLCWIALI